ncbi:type I-F CRISPR-associated helicase Cas3f [Testudinibacter sp. P27/CKL/0425]
MMVIFVSQCEKKALTRSRKVLDAFANRIGDNTWQTVITDDGLQTVRRLLRQTASKNTAVSCHWIRSRSRSDLLWIVGNRQRFNLQGVVPVNHTRRNLLHSEWENHCIASIQIIATLAALLHDLGKSTVGFQGKLRQSAVKGDPYRHEWISLKIFEWLLQGCSNDQMWLTRLADIKAYLANPTISLQDFLQQQRDAAKVDTFPPLAQWIAWLIVTHHRTAPFDKVHYNSGQIKQRKQDKQYLREALLRVYQHMKAVDFWVKNPTAQEALPKSKQEEYWQFDTLILASPAWQKAVKRWARKALQHQPLLQLSELAAQSGKPIEDTLLLQFSRLCLMMADYHYSSLDRDDKRRVSGAKEFATLWANTDKTTKEVKQTLDEHLLGVAGAAAQFARVLPIVAAELPRLIQQDSLIKNTAIPRFTWQNKAFQLAKSVQELSQENGFFGVNMASTGCGKTIGNARIMYALADKTQGARFTVALGLRVLTLQTGQSYRDNLGLNAAQLAILVGGSAQRKLYEMLNSGSADKSEQPEEIENELDENPALQTAWGSESADEIVEGFVDSTLDYSQFDNLNLETILDSSKAKQLLFSPITVCTVDHLIQASECKRGGKYMLPILRLLSSDLILDEPDDFDQADLPALTRLVHLVGLLGGRILLSSATLPPDLIQGLFNSYLAGRTAYHRHYGKRLPNVVCAWIDEQDKAMKTIQCQHSANFEREHLAFVIKRILFLQQQSVRRMAEVMPLNVQYRKDNPTQFFDELAQCLADSALLLHQRHHIQHPKKAEAVSVGLIRIANTINIVQLANAFNRAVKLHEDVHIHLCCYHARQLLLLRNILESRLDRTLKRDAARPESLFEQPDICVAIKQYPAKQHIFIVLATPVAEVGRDHDYDWAIVEPSSMRSIIQLAGRIWRHRPDKKAESANLLILQKNIRALQHEAVGFTKPGYESEQFKLATHDMTQLMPAEQLQSVDSIVRIAKPESLQPQEILADLEHQVIKDLLNHDEINFVNAYWSETATSNRATSHLQVLSPFRAGKAEDEWLLIPSDDGFDVYSSEQVRKLTLAASARHNHYVRYEPITFQNPQLSAWLCIDLETALAQLQQQNSEQRSLKSLAITYSCVTLDENRHGWFFNEWLGFWRNK